MVLDKYCQIVERDSATITVLWKASHLLCLLIATSCSLIAVWNLMYIGEVFGHNCILYANLTFTHVNTYGTVGTIPESFSFHNPLTIWGPEHICSYTKCIYLFSTVVGMIMLAFFAIFPKGGYAKTKSIYTEGWKLIPWAVVVASIMVICMIIAYKYTKNGIGSFTDQIYNKINETSNCYADEDKCKDDLNLFTLVFQPTVIWITNNIVILMVTSSIALGAWVVLFASLITRMILGVDFRIVVYNFKPVVKDTDSESTISSNSFSDDDERIKPNEKLVEGQIDTDYNKKLSSDSLSFDESMM